MIDNGGANGAIVERNVTWERYIGYGYSGGAQPRQSSTPPSFVTRADNIGDDFYALVFSVGFGNILTNDNNATKLQAEKRDKSQIMRFQRNSDDGTYFITAMSDGKALDVAQGNTQRSRVYFHPLHRGDNQRFRIEQNGDRYMLAPKSGPQLVLDAAGHQGNFADASQIWSFSRNNTNPQWFEIRKIDNADTYLNPKPTLTSLSITTLPEKQSYIVGETLDTKGMILTAVYSDGTREAISSGFTWSPTILTEAADTTISVNYGGMTALFGVFVNEPGFVRDETIMMDMLNGIVMSATITNLGIKFDWAPHNNHFGYRIFRSKSPNDEGISITDFPITSKDGHYAGQYFDVNIEPDTQYYYTIRAVEAEAGFNMATIEIIPERLGSIGAAMPVLTKKSSATETTPDEKENEPKKNFMLMTIGIDTMLVNDEIKEIDPGRRTAPIIRDGRTLTPIRSIIETMGGSVDWTPAESKITLTAYENILEMWINSRRLLRNGRDAEMDIAPAVINERTMLPLRFVSDNIGCEIAWIGSSQQIVIVFYTFGG
jgi:hypothetical protein